MNENIKPNVLIDPDFWKRYAALYKKCNEIISKKDAVGHLLNKWKSWIETQDKEDELILAMSNAFVNVCRQCMAELSMEMNQINADLPKIVDEFNLKMSQGEKEVFFNG